VNSAIASLNSLSTEAACESLCGCCGADRWVELMENHRPFDSVAELHAAADKVFDQLSSADWLAAFACHPPIGDLDSLRMKFAGNRQWSHDEQQGVNAADEAAISALAAGNAAYRNRFGYIFIVCATGKSAAEMLELLTARLQNDPRSELTIAAAEQRKITHLRIDKLLASLAPCP
jgi:2-oxo-4-hydroxy-4-carboxy-5-ureidoimidazoline decarboxylase